MRQHLRFVKSFNSRAFMLNNLPCKSMKKICKRKILRTKFISKSIVFLLCLMVLFSPHEVWAQKENPRVSIHIRDGALKQAIEAIKNQTGYKFFIDTKEVDLTRQLSLSIDKEPLPSALKQICEKTDLVFKIDGDRIYLNSKKQSASSVKVTGRVVDETGVPLIGVSVIVKGTTVGVSTDINGDFAIEASEASTLQFSYVGYSPQETKVGNRTFIDVILANNQTAIDEIVVVGYGTQKKVNLTGAVAVVDQKVMESRPLSRASQLLQGAVPNVNITYGSGQPTAGAKINIRGVNSISGNAEPLILIDGIEGNMDLINPNDIESISVLKDASSAAVYGARAAYGVVLITTKKGQDQKPTINYEGRFSISRPTTSTDFETRGYYSARINDMFHTTYQGKPFTSYTEEDYYQLYIRRNDKTEHPDRPWIVTDYRDGRLTYVHYANTDWYHYLYKDTSHTWEHNLSISGGSSKINYYISGNTSSKTGIFRHDPDKFNSYNFRSRVSAQLSKRLQLTNNTSYHVQRYVYPGPADVNNSFNNTNYALACFAPVAPDGTAIGMTSLGQNKLLLGGYGALFENGGHTNVNEAYRFSTMFDATYNICKGLDLTANYNYTRYSAQKMNRSVNIPYSQYPDEIKTLDTGLGLNQIKESTNSNSYHVANLYGTYRLTVADDHEFTLMAGVNYEQKHYKNLSVSRDNLLSDELNDLELAVGENIAVGGGQNHYALLGMFYRLNYSFKNGRYLFETSGRYDGSSRFKRGHRFGFFPSASAGWRISEEPFFEPVREVVDNLKLRVSYGALGNQQVGFYDYLQTIDTGGFLDYSFGSNSLAPSASVSAPNAADLTWETVTTYNLGLDLGLLRNRLTVTADAYIRDTKDMLTLGKELPDVYGAKEPKMNAADLRTKGWELAIAWRDQFTLAGEPFHYDISIGLADNTTVITKFDNPNKVIGTFYEGQKLGEIWGYRIDGLFASDEEAKNYPVDQSAVNSIINVSVVDPGLHAGDMKFVDLDGDKKISQGDGTVSNPGDREVIGNSLPRYTFSAQIGADWNGIDFSIFLQGVGRQDWYPGPNALMFWGPYARPYASFIPTDFLSKMWSPSNPDAYYPRPRGYIALSGKQDRSLAAINDRYLQSVAYCRIKNLTVGYTLPQKWTRKIGISKLRVYFSGENLFTFSNLKSDYIDPEQASAENTMTSGSSDAKLYPWQKTYSVGLNLNF